jgi:hypothetical protein
MKRGNGETALRLLAVALMLLAGCSRSSDGSVTSPAAKTTSAPEPLTFVALGDSWPEGAHCGYCATFAGRYADGLETLTGRPVDFVDLAGDAQPFFQTDGGGTASLLRALREVPSFADQVASGDVIMIATGPNEGGRRASLTALAAGAGGTGGGRGSRSRSPTSRAPPGPRS